MGSTQSNGFDVDRLTAGIGNLRLVPHECRVPDCRFKVPFPRRTSFEIGNVVFFNGGAYEWRPDGWQCIVLKDMGETIAVRCEDDKGVYIESKDLVFEMRCPPVLRKGTIVTLSGGAYTNIDRPGGWECTVLVDLGAKVSVQCEDGNTYTESKNLIHNVTLPTRFKRGDAVILEGGAYAGRMNGWECVVAEDLGEDILLYCMGDAQIYKESKSLLSVLLGASSAQNPFQLPAPTTHVPHALTLPIVAAGSTHQSNVQTLCHATRESNALSICSGTIFYPGVSGFLGPGIYFSKQPESARRYCQCRTGHGPIVVLICQVNLGKLKKVSRGIHTTRELMEEGFDSFCEVGRDCCMIPNNHRGQIAMDTIRIGGLS